jgi:hypothetical protein
MEVTTEFKDIQVPDGVFFSNGNHEEYRNTHAMMDALEKVGIQVLNNKKITVGGVDIIGITYHDTDSNR